MLLENLLNEKDRKLGELLEEVNEHRDSSSWLSNELEEMINLNEKLAATSDETSADQQGAASDGVGSIKALSQRKRSQLVERLKEFRLRNKSRSKANEFMLINRRSVNDGQQQQQQSAARSANLTGRQNGGPRNGLRPKQGVTKRGRDASLFDEIKSSSGLPASKSATSMSGSLSQDDEDDEDADEYDADGADLNNHALADGEFTEELAIEILGLLRRFHTAMQHRRDVFSTQSYLNGAAQLNSPNSADDSGISADDSKLRMIPIAYDYAIHKRIIANLFNVHVHPFQTTKPQANRPKIWRFGEAC